MLTKSRGRPARLKEDTCRLAPINHLNRHQLLEQRKQRGESQERFWRRFGVTQSSGSRFEAGESMPAPVALLLFLYLSEAIDDTHLERALASLSQ